MKGLEPAKSHPVQYIVLERMRRKCASGVYNLAAAQALRSEESHVPAKVPHGRLFTFHNPCSKARYIP